MSWARSWTVESWFDLRIVSCPALGGIFEASALPTPSEPPICATSVLRSSVTTPPLVETTLLPPSTT